MKRCVLTAGLAVALLWIGPAVAQTDSVTIDDQPTTEQNLGRINDLRRAGRQGDAADLLQELIDDARFKLITRGEGLYIDAELWAREELRRDPALLASYRDRFTASAERALMLAHEDGAMRGLREAHRRFGMTRPGLDAGLTLAGLLLEQGDIDAAWALLDELMRHPDQLEEQRRLLYLQAVCAMLAGDTERAADLAEQIRERYPEQAGRLAVMERSLSLPGGEAGGGLVDAGERPEGLDLPLWEAPIGEAQRPGRSTVDGLRSLPVVSGERVLVNTSRQVLALDRASGQQLWAYPKESGGRGLQGTQAVWLDTRGVAVSGGRVFAVVGECRGVQGRGGVESVRPNLLVCLDEQHGAVRWSRLAGQFEEDEPELQHDERDGRGGLPQTHFVGTPIAAQGYVFALLRRTSATGAQTTWLAAFDARTGRLGWFRHLALVQVRDGTDAKQITPQIRLDGEALYVSDQVAVVAALNIHSGAYRWLRVLADSASERLNNLSLATDGVNTPPVVTPSGLMVQLSTAAHRLFLLDPETGRTLRALHEDSRLEQVQYLLDAGGSVVVVARTFALLWDGDTGEVRWVHTFAQDAQPRGQGAVTQQFVVIPTQRGITALRLSDGELMEEVQSLAGNLTALDAEVLVSANGHISSYMSWDGAYTRLRDRVRRLPNDPGPGLSMATLALNRGDRDAAVLEGLGFALQAVDRLTGDASVAGRARVFDVLRQMVQADGSTGPTLRMELFDLMALTATTAEQTVSYHLDMGWHLAQVGDAERAVGHYQAVMVDPVLADTAYGRLGENVTGPAGASAQREMLALVREHGRSIYRRYDAMAQQELESAIAAGRPDPAALSRIARRYPLSLTASRALLMSAEQLEAQDEPIGALSQYQQALSRAITDDQRAAAAGALLSYYERSRRPGDAMPLLERLSREAVPVMPSREGLATALSAWGEVFLAMDDAGEAGPVLAGALGQPIVLPGRLLLPPDGIGPEALRGGLFVHTEEGEVVRLDASRGGAVVWSVPVEGELLHVLADDHGQVLIWSVLEHTLSAVDSATGESLWQRPADLGRLDEPAESALAPAPRRPLVGQGETRVYVGPSVVCFVGAAGRVVGVDRFRGEVRWQVETGIPHVTAVAADAWTLAVAGVVGPELNLRDGKLVLLDQYTGDPLLEAIDLHVGFVPRAIGIDASRLTVVADRSAQVTAFDVASGELLWRQRLSDAGVGSGGHGQDDLLAVGDAGGMVFALRCGEACEVVGRYRLAGDRDAESIRIQPMGPGLLVHGPGGAVALDAAGALCWRTETRLGEGALHHAVVGASRAALISAIDPRTDPDRILARGESVTYRLDLLDRAGGLLQRTYVLGPIQGQLDPRQAVITAGGLAVGMGPKTLLFPPGEEPTPDADENVGQ